MKQITGTYSVRSLLDEAAELRSSGDGIVAHARLLAFLDQSVTGF